MFTLEARARWSSLILALHKYQQNIFHVPTLEFGHRIRARVQGLDLVLWHFTERQYPMPVPTTSVQARVLGQQV